MMTIEIMTSYSFQKTTYFCLHPETLNFLQRISKINLLLSILGGQKYGALLRLQFLINGLLVYTMLERTMGSKFMHEKKNPRKIKLILIFLDFIAMTKSLVSFKKKQKKKLYILV